MSKLLNATIFQVGTIRGLLNKVYCGEISIKDLSQKGNFGIGTFNEVYGELIALNGQFYCADEWGRLSIAKEDNRTPFAAVGNFNTAEIESIDMEKFPLALDNIDNKFYNLEQFFLKELPFFSPNFIYAIKIEGLFSEMGLRSKSCQPHPYETLDKTIPLVRKNFEYNSIEGSIVGIWVPEYMASLNAPGFHLHFIDKDRKLGGHVFKFNLVKGNVSVQKYHNFSVYLPEGEAFEKADLNTWDENKTKIMEMFRV